MFDEFPDILNIDQVVKALRIGKTTAYKLIDEKEIEHFRIGKTIRIPKKALVNYVERSTNVCYSCTHSGQASIGCQKGEYT